MTMLCVALAIMQIDYPSIFARSLIKTEEFGISLMDTGVALITLNSGMSQRKARPWFRVLSWKSQAIDILTSIKENLVTAFSGFFRLCLMSELDYTEHASEYGIHWNFYTTVSVINILQSFLRDPKHAMTLAICLILAYQLVLTATPFQDYVFYAPRVDVVSANREGLLSLIGYFSLLLFGVGVGRFMLSQMVEPDLLAELTTWTAPVANTKSSVKVKQEKQK